MLSWFIWCLCRLTCRIHLMNLCSLSVWLPCKECALRCRESFNQSGNSFYLIHTRKMYYRHSWLTLRKSSISIGDSLALSVLSRSMARSIVLVHHKTWLTQVWWRIGELGSFNGAGHFSALVASPLLASPVSWVTSALSDRRLRRAAPWADGIAPWARRQRDAICLSNSPSQILSARRFWVTSPKCWISLDDSLNHTGFS